MEAQDSKICLSI